MKWNVIVILLFLLNILFSQTTIPAGDVSGTWDFLGSPYLIEGEIAIPDGQTLNIDPGCLIEFQGHYKFNVQGRLLAVGTELDSIRFTIADTTGFSNHSTPDGGWHGLRFDNTPTTNDSSKITYCHLEFGKAVGYEDNRFGGAIFVKNYSNLSIEKSLFKSCEAMSHLINNFAGKGGSIAVFDNSNIIVQNCYFKNNKSYYGGAIYCEYSDPYVEDCFFVGNKSNFRGGGISFSYSNSIILNCTFFENSSTDYGSMGGGAYFHSCNDMKIIKCTFSNNLAYDGGGIYFGGDEKIINCLVVNNTAELRGGGVSFNSSYGKIINCTIAKNESPVGGGLNCRGNDSSIINTLIFDNGISNININDNYQHSVDPFFIFCDIEYGLEGLTGGGVSHYITSHYQNCIESSPKFMNPTHLNGANYNGLDADYSLELLSPCINFGNPDTLNLNLPEFDLAGNIRIYSEIIDIGAYENFDFFTNFSALPKEGVMPLLVNFQNYSNGTHNWWEWDFESDGNIDSYQENPSFVYEENGLYTVTLNSGNSIESDIETKLNFIDVQYVLDAEFSVDTVSGTTPLTVTFTDISIGNIETWEWDFDNDGNIDSYDQNPIWTYVVPGTYSVKLAISDGNSISEELSDSLITVHYQNELSGIIDEDTILSSDTVNVVDEVTVLDGITLTIEPGVTMLFQGHYKLNIQGRLLAEGTEQDSIFFTARDHNMGWHGIRFENTPATNDSSRIQFCKLQYGKAISDIPSDENGGSLFIDGFEKIHITNCVLLNNYAQSKGGAIYNSGSVILDEITLHDNYAGENGGSIYIASNTIVRDCNIYNNQSGGNGGGIYSAANLTLYNCNINNNQADDNGGGISIHGSSIIYNSLITDNNSSFGGGVFISYNSSFLNNLTICNNSAQSGGGLFINNNSSIMNCKITNNQSSGIYIDNSSPKILNSLVCNNGSSGIYIFEMGWEESNPKITNCTIANNGAYGIQYYYYEEWWEPKNDGNNKNKNKITAKPLGNRSVSGKNNLFSGNTSGDAYSNMSSSPNLIFCAFSNDLPSFAGTGCISTEPYFIDPTLGAGANYNALEADWSLLSNSMCIDHGTPDTTGLYLPEFDLMGNPRVFQGITPRIDIGAYEFQGEPDQIPDIYAYPRSFDFYLCSINSFSLEKSFKISNIGFVDLEIFSITAPECFFIKRENETEYGSAIEQFTINADSTETINIIFHPNLEYTYSDNIIINSNDPDESISTVGVTGIGDIYPVVYGNISEDTIWDSEIVKVTGNITVEDGKTLIITPGTTIKFMNKFQIDVQGRILAEGTEQDSINFISKNSDSWWNGIKFDCTPVTNDSSKFVYCKFQKATSIYGGAFYIRDYSDIEISYCLITDNKTRYAGGGLYIWNSDINLNNTKIVNNTATGYCDNWGMEYSGEGGGIFLVNSNLDIKDCLIAANETYLGEMGNTGVAIYSSFSSVNLINCQLYDNEAYSSDTIYLRRSNLNIYNSIISKHDFYNGNVIFAADSTNISLLNTIIYHNTGNNVRFSSWGVSNTFYADYSCIEGGENSIIHIYNGTVYWEENNIEDDPLFVDPEIGDFHLQAESPCINSGTPSGWIVPALNLSINELLGYDSIDENYDIGCYEYQEYLLDQNDIDFGEIQFNTTSEGVRVIISNISEKDILISSIEASDNFLVKQNEEDQYTDQIDSIDLLADSEVTFWIACHPRENGLVEGDISISSNAIPSRAVITVSANVIVVDRIKLYHNFPNPFNPSTTIQFSIPQESEVELTVYNIKGQKVKTIVDATCEMGINTAIWNGTNNFGNRVGTGIYFYQLKVDGKAIKTKKMMLIK